MNYGEMPVIIPILAASYLLTVYVLLMMAQRPVKVTPTQSHDVSQMSSWR